MEFHKGIMEFEKKEIVICEIGSQSIHLNCELIF